MPTDVAQRKTHVQFHLRTYVRTYVHVGNYVRTYVGTYVAGCVSHAVLSRCKRNRIYVGMYYVCTYVKCFLRMDVLTRTTKPNVIDTTM